VTGALATPQNEFVRVAFEQSTEFVAAGAAAATTAGRGRTQVQQTCGGSGWLRSSAVPSLVYAATP
jgi:hypothetical protein